MMERHSGTGFNEWFDVSEVTEHDVKSPRPGLPWPVLGVLAVLAVGGAVAVVTWPRATPSVNGNDSSGDDSSAVDNTKLALPEKEALYLQDAEHLGGFVLGDLSFPLIAAALKTRDQEGLAAFFSEEFRGEIFAAQGGRAETLGFAELRTWQEGRDPRQDMNREEFVAQLLKWRDEFSNLSAVGVKVMLMRPETRGSFDGPWVGSFKLRLAGRDRQDRAVERIVRFQCRLTGLAEDQPEQRGWLAECRAYRGRYSRSSQQLLEPMIEQTGIDVSRLHDNWKRQDKKNLPFLTGGTYLVDFDQDGKLDVLVTDLGGLALYRGQGAGRFTNVTLQVELPPLSAPSEPPPLGAVFADFNGDGFPDLLLGHRLYRNVEGKRFEPLLVGRDTNLQLDQAASQFAVADFDRDGRVDLYVVGLADGSPEGQPWIGRNEGNRNQLWHNQGDWQFEDVTQASGTQGQGGPTFAAVWLDANEDDYPDLMTSCETGINDYLINQKDGTFKQSELPDIYGGFSMGISSGDIDNDGRPDVYVANMYSKAGERIVDNLKRGVYPDKIDAQMRDFVSGNELYHNLGKGRYERIGARTGVADVGWAYGPGFVDLDNDGWLDLYAPVGFQSVTPERPDG